MLGSLATNLVPSPHHSFGPLFLCFISDLVFTEALLETGKVVFPKFLQSFMNVSSFQNCRLVKRNPITQMI